MKFLKTLLRIFIYLIVLGLLAGWVYIRYISYSPVPNYNKDLGLKGLTDKVTVYRDSLGVPHVFARNEADLYRATGYLEAQDRLWQMDLLRHVTEGRLSEIFGKDYIQTDLLLRALQIPEKSKRLLDSLNRNEMIGLKAFADGVNQYIAQHRHSLPVEFRILGYRPEPWKPQHSLNLIGFIAWNLDKGTNSTEILLYRIMKKAGREKTASLLPFSGRKQILVYPDFSIDSLLFKDKANLLTADKKLTCLGVHLISGSNNWAVSPAKSVSGHAMLANDMHLDFNMPGIWYRIHQVVKGHLNVTGVLFPGEPAIVAGHNEQIAWGMTNLYVDDIDLFHETLSPDHPGKYLFNDKWKPLKIKKEIIGIKGEKEVTDTLYFTHHGPLISRLNNLSEALSMQWTGFGYSNEYKGLYIINRGKNWEDFKKGLQQFKSVSQNFIYTDTKGDIGLYAAGGVPVRKDPGPMIRPGDTSLYDWTGLVPPDLLPHTYNPPDHQVSSANNKTTNDRYPYYIGTYYAQYYRIERIREMLNAKEKLSEEDFENMQADQHSKLAANVTPEFYKVLSTAHDTFSPVEKQAIKLLHTWDGDMSANQQAPLVFEVFFKHFLIETVQDELGPELTRKFLTRQSLFTTLFENIMFDPSLDWLDDIRTKNKKETFRDITLRAFHAAIKEISGRYGKKPAYWTWGKVHYLILVHPLGKVKILNKVFHLNKGPFPVGGSFHTVSPYSYPLTEPFHILHGASQRHIFIAGDWDKSLTILPTGECGVPASDFYGNQAPLYVKYKYHRDYFSRDLIIKNAKFRMSFLPAK